MALEFQRFLAFEFHQPVVQKPDFLTKEFFRRKQITRIPKIEVSYVDLCCNICDPSDKQSQIAAQVARFRIGVELDNTRD